MGKGNIWSKRIEYVTNVYKEQVRMWLRLNYM